MSTHRRRVSGRNKAIGAVVAAAVAGGTKPAADPTCSSILQDEFAFSKAFAAYK
ncbi:hypothetical protein ACWDUB_00490 [Streptomyces fungicidicus]